MGVGGSGSAAAAAAAASHGGSADAGMAGLVADAAALEEMAARQAEDEESRQRGEVGSGEANQLLPGYSARPSASASGSKGGGGEGEGAASGAGSDSSGKRATTKLGAAAGSGNARPLQVVTQPDDVITVRQLKGRA